MCDSLDRGRVGSMVGPSSVETRSLPRPQRRRPIYSADQTATLNTIDSASPSPTCRPVTTVDTKSLSLALLYGEGYAAAGGGSGNFYDPHFNAVFILLQSCMYVYYGI
jgi:hypothetical protein